MKKIHPIIKNIIIFIILIITIVINLKLYNFKFSECYIYCTSSGSCVGGYALNRFAYTEGKLHIIIAIIFIIIYLLLLFRSIKLLKNTKNDNTAKKVPTIIGCIINILLIIVASFTIFYNDIKYGNKAQIDLPVKNYYGTFTEVNRCEK